MKVHKKAIVVSFLILFFNNLYGQDETDLGKSRSFMLGTGMLQLKESALHGKVHSGIPFLFTYSSGKISEKISVFQSDLSFSRPKTGFEDVSVSVNVKLNFQYRYLFPVFSSGNSKLYTGPSAWLHYDLSFYPNWDESHLYWADFLSAGVYNRYSYETDSGNKLIVNFNLPLFSLISRPEEIRNYKIDDVSFGGILKSMHSIPFPGTLNRAIAPDLSIEYQFSSQCRISHGLVYHWNYFRISEKNASPFYSNLHSVGLKFIIQ